MPNGRPGDHPLTDILSYGASSSYPEDINLLVGQLARMVGFDAVRERVANILWADWPAWQNVKPDLGKVRELLNEIRQELLAKSNASEA